QLKSPTTAAVHVNTLCVSIGLLTGMLRIVVVIVIRTHSDSYFTLTHCFVLMVPFVVMTPLYV
ncbi:hypothetical protein DFH07DRAFT_818614, partial [Mycena maculata]